MADQYCDDCKSLLEETGRNGIYPEQRQYIYKCPNCSKTFVFGFANKKWSWSPNPPLDYPTKEEEYKATILELLYQFGDNWALSAVEHACAVLNHPKNEEDRRCFCHQHRWCPRCDTECTYTPIKTGSDNHMTWHYPYMTWRCPKCGWNNRDNPGEYENGVFKDVCD